MSTTANTESVYPVRLEGELDPGISRWLWLVKWLLIIPHAIILAFLWLAVIVLTIVAFFAILFTGRYPRGIFDFNLGVLRWTWRVGFYSYSALGTDRYPPFTLGPADGYPATFEIDYPEHLNRWLPLVKWLLGIPHYIIVGIFIGGAGWGVGRAGDGAGWAGGWSLVGILVFISAVLLLFTNNYPKSIFDFVIGMNRWAARVAPYALLMRDEYPPFRLDNGAHEPGPQAPTERQETRASAPGPNQADTGS